MAALNFGVAGNNSMEVQGYMSGRHTKKLKLVILLIVVFLWKLCYDLPHLKSDEHLFSEFFNVTFVK